MARGLGSISWFDNPSEWRPTVKTAAKRKPILDDKGNIVGYGDEILDEYGEPVSTKTIPTGFKTGSDIEAESKDRLSRALESLKGETRVESAKIGAGAKEGAAETAAEARVTAAEKAAEARVKAAEEAARATIEASKNKGTKKNVRYDFSGGETGGKTPQLLEQIENVSAAVAALEAKGSLSDKERKSLTAAKLWLAKNK